MKTRFQGALTCKPVAAILAPILSSPPPIGVEGRLRRGSTPTMQSQWIPAFAGMTNVLSVLLKRHGTFQVGIGVLLLALNAWAGVEVKLQVSTTQLTPDDQLLYVVTVESDEDIGEVKVNIPPSWKQKGLKIYGPSTSTGSQVQIINGAISSIKQRSLRYQMVFEKPGKVSLEGASVTVDGKTSALKSVGVDVDEKYAQKYSQKQSPRMGRKDPFGFFDQFFENFGSRFQAGRPPKNDDVQLVLQPSSTHVLEGEPIWVKLIAYVHRGFKPQNIRPRYDLASHQLFWVEYIDQEGKVLPSTGPGSDVAYQLSEFVLFPLESGSDRLDNITVDLDLMTLTQAYPFTATAKPVKFTIDPLPDPRPELPLVSDELNVSFSVEKKTATVDQPIAFEFKTRGMANLRLIDKLPITPVENVDVVSQGSAFDVVQVPRQQFEVTQSGYLIFREPGTYTLTVDAIAYYNPQRRRYEKTQAHTATIDVSLGSSTAASTAASTQPSTGTHERGSGKRSESVEKAAFQTIKGWFESVSTGMWLTVVLLMIVGGVIWALWWSSRATSVYQTPHVGQTESAEHETSMTELVQQFNVVRSKSMVTVADIFTFLQAKKLLGSGSTTLPQGVQESVSNRFESLYDQFLKQKFSGTSEAPPDDRQSVTPDDKQIVLQVAEELVKNSVKG